MTRRRQSSATSPRRTPRPTDVHASRGSAGAVVARALETDLPVLALPCTVRHDDQWSDPEGVRQVSSLIYTFPSEIRLDVLVHRGGRWYVFNEARTRVLGGPYGSKGEAEERLRQVDYYKAHPHH